MGQHCVQSGCSGDGAGRITLKATAPRMLMLHANNREGDDKALSEQQNESKVTHDITHRTVHSAFTKMVDKKTQLKKAIN